MIEAQRIEQRTNFDLEMIAATGGFLKLLSTFIWKKRRRTTNTNTYQKIYFIDGNNSTNSRNAQRR